MSSSDARKTQQRWTAAAILWAASFVATALLLPYRTATHWAYGGAQDPWVRTQTALQIITGDSTTIQYGVVNGCNFGHPTEFPVDALLICLTLLSVATAAVLLAKGRTGSWMAMSVIALVFLVAVTLRPPAERTLPHPATGFWILASIASAAVVVGITHGAVSLVRKTRIAILRRRTLFLSAATLALTASVLAPHAAAGCN